MISRRFPQIISAEENSKLKTLQTLQTTLNIKNIPTFKHIIYIGNDLNAPGSLPTGITALSANLRREGYEVITASSKKGKLPRMAEMLYTVWQNRKWADVVLIDTYSTWNFWYAYAVARLCGRLGLPYIPILHGGDLPGRLKRSPGASRRLFGGAYVNVAPSGYLVEVFSAYLCRDRSRPVLRGAEGYVGQIASCPYTERNNTEENNIEGNNLFTDGNNRSGRVVHIPNSIDLSNYPFKARKNVSPKLLWVRAFQELYEPLIALKTLQLLLQKYPEAELCMVGPDKDGSLQQCRAYAEAHGLPVKFPGRLSKSEWPRLSSDYDLFLNTSSIDNTPLSLIEAMALGLPLISTGVGGIPYMISDGEDGLLVPPGDAASMATAVTRLLEFPALAENISGNARQKVEDFDWEVVKNSWVDLLGTKNKGY